jgi:hypothetical protein
VTGPPEKCIGISRISEGQHGAITVASTSTFVGNQIHSTCQILSVKTPKNSHSSINGDDWEHANTLGQQCILVPRIATEKFITAITAENDSEILSGNFGDFHCRQRTEITEWFVVSREETVGQSVEVFNREVRNSEINIEVLRSFTHILPLVEGPAWDAYAEGLEAAVNLRGEHRNERRIYTAG